MYSTGHGLHAEQVEKMYNASDTIFSLTQEQKDSLMVETKTGLTRGYVSMGGESGSDALEVKEVCHLVSVSHTHTRAYIHTCPLFDNNNNMIFIFNRRIHMVITGMMTRM